VEAEETSAAVIWEAEMTISAAVTWTLENRKIFTILTLSLLFLNLASAFHGDMFSYSSADHFYESLEDPRTALTNFVAPFLLVAIIFQRGFEKALAFSYADDDDWIVSGSRSAEKKRVRKYSMLMSLTVTGMIVPSPYFQFLQDYVAVLFGTISYVFFFAIIAGFLWVLWSAFN
jgi:hypothetical protein